jgi:hypothetical protein
MIEYIECLSKTFQTQALSNGESATDPGIHVEKGKTDTCVP